ncbi:hypothetical protein SDC9_115754 [bioreactor metagenome]|uniref:Uncharacterized protein n=1 Tax=bioreactor metagenome TaxID=1076179 RepID=A0A645BTS3_9ZZZZ
MAFASLIRTFAEVPFRVYRRQRIDTVSAACAARGLVGNHLPLHRRWGIAPRPEALFICRNGTSSSLVIVARWVWKIKHGRRFFVNRSQNAHRSTVAQQHDICLLHPSARDGLQREGV